PVRIPGKAGKAYRAGANLTLEGAETGERTWEEFLAERV
ncbi:MAG: NAD-dependent epimerase/dehydratase family protein, partial [Streptomyces sp.]|nr:NAD-dependent epimerase/dehydratase family protein [Streptomyces sp.]